MIATAHAAAAADPACTKRGVRVTELTGKGYAITARGANEVGHMVEVLTKPAGAWIEIETWANGCSRIVDRGTLWRIIVSTKETPT